MYNIPVLFLQESVRTFSREDKTRKIKRILSENVFVQRRFSQNFRNIKNNTIFLQENCILTYIMQKW